MPRRSRKYEIGLAERLKDKAYAVNYLNAALDDSDEAFFLALRDVADVQRGMTQVAADADVNRENLYRMLSGKGNPRHSSFRSVLTALKLKYHVEEALAFSNTSPRMTAQTKVGKRRSIQGSPRNNQLAFSFVAGGHPYNQLSATGMGTLTVAPAIPTGNNTAMVGGFGPEVSQLPTKVTPIYPLRDGQWNFQTATGGGRILPVGGEKQQEEANSFPTLCGRQLPAPYDPIKQLTR